MRIYYRGYIIDEEIRSISYSVYGQRPERQELIARSTPREAMEWIDNDVKQDTILESTRTLQGAAFYIETKTTEYFDNPLGCYAILWAVKWAEEEEL